METKYIICIIVIMSVLNLLPSSCSLDNRVELAKTELQKRVNNESEGAIKLYSLQKTDGKELNFMGAKRYEMDFNSIIEYQKDCFNSFNTFPQGWAYSSFKTYDTAQPVNSYYGTKNVYSPKGKKVRLRGVAEFEKKESGWVLRVVNVTGSRDLN